MSITKVLKQVAEPKFKEFGFKYTRKVYSTGWQFSRMYREVEQFVLFEKIGSKPAMLRFSLFTSVNLIKMPHNRLNEELQKYLMGFEYHDYGSLVEAVEFFTHHIITEGLTGLIALVHRMQFRSKNIIFNYSVK